MKTTYDLIKEKVSDIVPDIELKYKTELVESILELKNQKNILILGHNYMEPVLFNFIPDYVGDSLELCRKSQSATNDIIIFCGVQFMAETAKILNPTKRVLIPSLKAGCSLASSITAQDVRELKLKFPGVPVVTYINTYADVKAESDICCTSGNAVDVVNSLKSQTVIFIPDEYLAKNVAKQTNKHIIFPKLMLNKNYSEIDYQMVGWNGRCEVHEKFMPIDIESARNQFPDTIVLSHPECSPEVIEKSDFSGSTSEMLKYIKNSNAKRYLLLTECSMADNIVANNPEKTMLRLCSVRCQHMNQITLENVLQSIQELKYEISIPEHIMIKAKQAIDRMLLV